MSNGLKFPLINDLSRKIIHIDMDAFYASIEERDNPKLKGKPLVIAKHPKDTNGRGVVTTANYEARKYGIHSAMSAKKAYELCPHATFVAGNREYYSEISKQIHEVFKEYTDIIEPLSLDEAYLDVTHNKKGIKSAIKIARMIQSDIYEKVQLTSSAGVSYNKFLAKIASDFEKPKGLTLILPEQAQEFLLELPIEKFYGIGKKTIPLMHDLGIYTGKDLYNIPEMTLIDLFGKKGYSLYRKVRGIHNDPVENNRERKSIGRERTFSKTLMQEQDVLKNIREMAEEVSKKLIANELKAQTIVMKIRNNLYETVTKRITINHYIYQSEDIFFYATQLWEELNWQTINVRLVGVTVTTLDKQMYEAIELPLFIKKG
ncbi:DNA polymerase IV [Vagococcus teuberi]|uniref:DNA polymerase IV n=1 Tax=Vagococcus teuberi TaxID=519472 RepID=A0A1J0A7A3_9ENTE|nr:DNA polymerase IV [Vagococcus teuberi]APB31793.1 DNA polymerase IV [Vagococcus teuberi]